MKKEHTKIRPHGQMSDSFATAAFLSLSGGLQDSYTYLLRGRVFANAQTGNLVLLSQCIIQRQWNRVLHYLIPIFFFAFGVAAAELIRERFRKTVKIHWRQLVLADEIFLLFLVGCLPGKFNLLANAMVSFSCAMQVQAFRKVNGYAFASTMCIGNMRSGMESLCAYRETHHLSELRKAARYCGIILLFALGAGAGSCLLSVFGLHTIWISCFLLLISLCLMFMRDEISDHPEIRQEEKAIISNLKDIRNEIHDIEQQMK